MSCGELIDSQV